MVKIAIAGAGQVASEVIDGLLATGKHEVVILSRRDAPPEPVQGTSWVRVDYQDRQALVRSLDGVHTVLSFITVHLDENAVAQKTLIDAAIEAGVKRFAPSEWGIANIDHLAWYDGKLQVRKYLEEKNKDAKVIEYSLFQPGWFLNYLAGNRQTAKHVQPNGLFFVDHEKGVAHVAGDLTEKYTYTTVADLVNIVVKAVEYEGEWPKIGGINGNTLSFGEEIAIGEKVRGKPFEVEILQRDDLKAGVVKTSWRPVIDHPSLAAFDKEEISKTMLCSLLLNMTSGHGYVSDEWNRIFPDYKFTTVEEFLAGLFANQK